MLHQSAEESRAARTTYHLVPSTVWERQREAAEYLPEQFDADGFIHCTNGLDELQKVGNMFYTGDDREHSVLVLDMDRIASDVRYDDPDEVYPHIYGPLNTDAVIGVLGVERAQDGTFTGFHRQD